MRNLEKQTRTIARMSSSVRRSTKMLTGAGRNFGRRDWTSIGLRAARATFGNAEIRTKLVSPVGDLSYTHKEESRIVGFAAPAPDLSVNFSEPSDKHWSELLWLALIILAVAAAAVQAIK
jgi:hypothetical protein